MIIFHHKSTELNRSHVSSIIKNLYNKATANILLTVGGNSCIFIKVGNTPLSTPFFNAELEVLAKAISLEKKIEEIQIGKYLFVDDVVLYVRDYDG